MGDEIVIAAQSGWNALMFLPETEDPAKFYREPIIAWFVSPRGAEPICRDGLDVESLVEAPDGRIVCPEGEVFADQVEALHYAVLGWKKRRADEAEASASPPVD